MTKKEKNTPSKPKWFTEDFKTLKKEVKRNIHELRMEFCLDIEFYVEQCDYDPDFDRLFAVKSKRYFKEIRKWKEYLNILEGRIYDGPMP